MSDKSDRVLGLARGAVLISSALASLCSRSLHWRFSPQATVNVLARDGVIDSGFVGSEQRHLEEGGKEGEGSHLMLQKFPGEDKGFCLLLRVLLLLTLLIFVNVR